MVSQRPKGDPKKISRRAFVIGLTSAPLVAPAISHVHLIREEQRGDLNLPYESINIDRDFMEGLSAPTRANWEERADDFPALVENTAASFLGQTRKTSPDSIAKMLELFNLPFQDASGKYVPFCACGISYVVALAYVGYWNKRVNLTTLRGALADIDHNHFFPSASVRDMFAVAGAKKRWVSYKTGFLPKRGWLAIYDFGKGADHVGMILSSDKDGMKTFECNTSGNNDDERDGGVITTKWRDWQKYGKRVKGFVRTDLVTIL